MRMSRTAGCALAIMVLLSGGSAHAAEPRPVETPSAVEDRTGWPQPTGDDAPNTFILLDLLEYQESHASGTIRWDFYGWYGGDEKRVWIKTEGTQSTARGGGGDAEAQLLYGQLISPFFDAQAGVRLRHRSGPGQNVTRTYASIGLQGLAPYRYELEPTIFISERGQVSARVTATYDQLLSQRLILQPRLEINIAAQPDRPFGTGAGLTDTELGARLRYELRRELAPYVGVTWKERYGETKRLARADGEPGSLISFVVGVRIWF